MWFRLATFLVASWLLVVLAAPFAAVLFVAAILAAALFPLHRRLRRVTGKREHLAAGLVTTGATLLIVVPVSVLGLMIAKHVEDVADWSSRRLASDGISGLTEAAPEPLRGALRAGLEAIPEGAWRAAFGEVPAGVEERAEEEGSEEKDRSLSVSADVAAKGSVLVVRAATSTALQLGVLVAALFFLLAEGRRLVEYVVDITPLHRVTTTSALDELRRVALAVFRSSLLTALAQTAVAAVGYFVASVPAISLVLFTTFLFAFVPAVGAAGVTGLIGILLWLAGDTTAGVGLLLWAVGPVGLTDNFLKPILATEDAGLPPSVLFFAMISGLSVFGPAGLLAGPVIVAMFVVATKLVRGEWTPEKESPALAAERAQA